MSVTEIKTMISELPPPDLAELSQWLEELQADAWDRQIERDALAGRFDALADQANQEFEAGRCRPL